MKTFRKHLFLLLALLGIAVYDAKADVVGEGWALKGGTLTIYESIEHDDAGSYPWHRHRSQIKSVAIKGGTVIGAHAFEGCGALTSIEMIDGITTIGSSAFSSCSALTNVELTDDITSIGSSAFFGCTSLVSIDLPESLTTIEDKAFYGCSALTSIIIPPFMTTIGAKAFYMCESLSSVTSLTEPGITLSEDAFTYIADDAVLYYSSDVKDSYGYSWPTWSKQFKSKYAIDVITLDTSIELLYNETTTLTPTSEYNSLKHITWSSSDESIATVDRNGTVTAIEEGTTNIVAKLGAISKTCEIKVVNCKFNENTGLLIIAKWYESHIWGEDKYEWYKYRTKIKTVEIRKGVTMIGTYAFEDCKILTSITIPQSVTSIKTGAFDGCKSLTSITIPEKVTSIEYAAFRDCSNLTSINIPEGVKTIEGDTFYGCSSLTSINIPQSVTSIEERAFGECESLTNIIIPEGVTLIGEYAFSGCSSLTSITIPEGVTLIENGAFFGCSSLTSVTSLVKQAPSLGDDAFNKINSNAVLYYPPGSDYSSWAAYFSRIAEIGTPENIPVSSIALDQSTKTLTAGSSFTLTATVTPDNATDKTVTWTTSNSSVATVNNGVVNAIGVGTATITAKVGDYTATCVVTVEQGNVEHDVITSIDQLSNTQLYYVSQPNHSKGLTSWAVAEGGDALKSNVDLGLTADGNDPCQQFAFLSNDGGATYYLYHAAEQKFVNKDGSLSSEPTDSINFKSGAYEGTFFAYFDNAHQINVNDYRQMTIDNWGTADGGNSCILVPVATFDPTEALDAFTVKVTGITLSQSAKTITEGDSFTLTATVTPDDAVDKTVTWITSNSSVATVNNGVVTAVSAGTATITAKAGDYTATCVVTVEQGNVSVSVTGITLSQSTKTLTAGSSFTLTATVTPNNATDKTVTWTTSNYAVATVNNGVVNAIGVGTATITAKAGNCTATCVVTVEQGNVEHDGITSIDQLSNTQLYYVSQPNHSKGLTSWAVAEGGDALKSNVDLGLTADGNDPRQQFAFLSNDGGATYYLYHAAEQKFVNKDGSLSSEPTDSINFKSGAYEGTFFAYFDNAHQINVGGYRQMTIDNWGTADGGNSCVIVPVASFDPTGALFAMGGYFNESTGHLIIAENYSYSYKSDYPWHAYREQITSVEIREGVTEIGAYALYGCSNIQSVTIPASIYYIGAYAFNACDNLTEVHISNMDSWLNIDFGGDFTNPLTKAGNLYLSGKLVTTLVVPNHITEIKDYAFDWCKSLNSVTFHSNITSIGNSAFSYCTNLKNVISFATTAPQLASRNPIKTSQDAILYYPSGSDYTSWQEKFSKTLPFVTSIDQLSNTQLYYVSQPFRNITSWAVDEESDVLKSTLGLDIATNSSDTCQQFAFISNDGGATRYMYYPAKKKFVNKDKSLTDKPTDPIYFKEGAYGNTFMAYFDDSHYVNITSGGWLTIDTWHTPDGGNSCILVPVATFDPTEALDAFTVKVTGITLSQSTKTLTIGDSFTLTATVTPNNATDKTVTWTTSNYAVATVNNGVVNAIGVGTATITAKAGNCIATCVVTVEQGKVEHDGITSIDQLSNTQLYYVSQSKHSKGLTSWAVAEGGDALKSNVDLGLTADGNDPRQQFAFLSNDGGATYYLYHAAEQKFVNKDGSLSSEPTDSINFKSGAYESTFFAYFDNAHQINVNGSRQMIIDSWGTADGGNSCAIVPVATVDLTEALVKMGWYFNASTGHLIIAKDYSYSNRFEYPWHEYREQITSVEIREGVTEIGAYALYGCSNLQSITIPASINAMGTYAFAYCINLAEVHISSMNAWMNIDFLGEYANPLVHAHDLYLNGELITNLVIPNHVTKIKDFIFDHCNLTSVTLHSGITSLGLGTFSNCKSLTNVISFATTAPTIASDFSISSNAVLYYPSGSDYTAWSKGFSKTLPFITSIDQLSNTQLYYVSQPYRNITSWAVDEESNVLKSNVEAHLEANSSDVCQQFAFISNDGGATRYMYYPEKKMFVSMDGSLTDKPTDPIYFKEGAYDNTFIAYFNEEHYINVSTNGSALPMHINSWHTPDGGNSCILVPVATFDPTEALDAFTVKVTGITLSQSAKTITEGDSFTLTATVTPDDAVDKTVTWTTSNSSVATVNNGVVTAVGVGTATITAQAGDYTATCVVTVEKKVVEVTDIKLDKASASLEEGETLTLTATVTPDDATDKTVTWSSSKPEIASVDENGVVTAIKAGRAIIYAMAGDQKASCIVNVKPAAGIDEVTNDKDELTIYDLTGRKILVEYLEELPAGIYIINGKKTVIK